MHAWSKRKSSNQMFFRCKNAILGDLGDLILSYLAGWALTGGASCSSPQIKKRKKTSFGSMGNRIGTRVVTSCLVIIMFLLLGLTRMQEGKSHLSSQVKEEDTLYDRLKLNHPIHSSRKELRRQVHEGGFQCPNSSPRGFVSTVLGVPTVKRDVQSYLVS